MMQRWEYWVLCISKSVQLFASPVALDKSHRSRKANLLQRSYLLPGRDVHSFPCVVVCTVTNGLDAGDDEGHHIKSSEPMAVFSFFFKWVTSTTPQSFVSPEQSSHSLQGVLGTKRQNDKNKKWQKHLSFGFKEDVGAPTDILNFFQTHFLVTLTSWEGGHTVISVHDRSFKRKW